MMDLKTSKTLLKITEISWHVAELMMIIDIPDWVCVLENILDFLHMLWNLLSLEVSRTFLKIYVIYWVFVWVDDDYGHSWLGLLYLMTFWNIFTMFKIWFKSVELIFFPHPNELFSWALDFFVKWYYINGYN